MLIFTPRVPYVYATKKGSDAAARRSRNSLKRQASTLPPRNPGDEQLSMNIKDMLRFKMSIHRIGALVVDF
jgi:hypothetical protein